MIYLQMSLYECRYIKNTYSNIAFQYVPPLLSTRTVNLHDILLGLQRETRMLPVPNLVMLPADPAFMCRYRFIEMTKLVGRIIEKPEMPLKKVQISTRILSLVHRLKAKLFPSLWRKSVN